MKHRYRFCCICIAHSEIILITKAAFHVPVLQCSCSIYSLILLQSPSIRILSLVIGLIKLIVQCSSHPFASGFCGITTKVHQYIFIILVILFIPKLFMENSIFITISSGPTASFLFTLANVDFTSDATCPHMLFYVL